MFPGIHARAIVGMPAVTVIRQGDSRSHGQGDKAG